MTHPRRVHRLLSVCVGLALTACAGQIEVENGALTSDSSPAPYAAGQRTVAATDATQELTNSNPPAPNTTPVAPTTGASNTGSRTPRPSDVDTTPDARDSEPQAPAAPTPVQPPASGS